MTTFLEILGVLGSMAWIGHLLRLIRHRDSVVFLADLPGDEPEGSWPTVAVIFAARDEAGMVGAATRSMLGQDYPSMELVAVDDRSADGTGAILDAIAADRDGLRVVHVTDLPAGWLGKTHALQAGAEATSSRWLLFTDADVVFEPWVVRRSVAFAESEKLDHLTVGPEVVTESVGERAFLAIFGLIFAMNAPMDRIEDRRSKAHAGIGAFNLVRRRTFHDLGGFRRLGLSVDDDMRLGRMLKFAGYRSRLILGAGAIRVRWQVGLFGYIRGLEKNFFAAVGFSAARAMVVMLALAVVGIGPFVGLFVGPWWARLICGVAVGSIGLTLAAANRQSRVAWWYVALIPFATLATMFALARSTALTLARDGVVWRGHRYPLRDLKAHVRLRDAWMRELWRSTR